MEPYYSASLANDYMQVDKVLVKQRSRLLRFIRKSIREESDAEDILQDVLLQLVVAYGELRSAEKVLAWMFSVARNKIIDYFRKKSRSPFQFEEGKSSNVESSGLGEIMTAGDLDPEQEIMRELIWDGIQNALDELPKEQREVFILTELEHMTFSEISERTGVSVNTLLSRKRYAIRALRKHLQELYNLIN